MNLVQVKKKEIITTSRVIAKKFGKRHDNVISKIEKLESMAAIDEEFSRLNFKVAKYKDRQGKERKEYYLTRDGMSFLIMGFNGEKAAQFKVDFINAFNAMEEYIKSREEARIGFRPMTDAIADNKVNPKSYDFSNEADMINRIVLNLTAKQFKKAFDISEKEGLRKYLTKDQLDNIQRLQQINTGLIYAGMDYQERKSKLSS